MRCGIFMCKKSSSCISDSIWTALGKRNGAARPLDIHQIYIIPAMDGF